MTDPSQQSKDSDSEERQSVQVNVAEQLDKHMQQMNPAKSLLSQKVTKFTQDFIKKLLEDTISEPNNHGYCYKLHKKLRDFSFKLYFEICSMFTSPQNITDTSNICPMCCLYFHFRDFVFQK